MVPDKLEAPKDEILRVRNNGEQTPGDIDFELPDESITEA